MKRVTFLIGNGFDINIGLKTQYSDFYKYYIQHSTNHKLSKEIQADIKRWADLEYELGKYTAKIRFDEMNSFLVEEDHLEQILADYLENECKKIKIDTPQKKEKIAIQMQDYLMNFYKGLNNEQKKHIKKYFSMKRESIEYSFINFNYTDTLEKILKITEDVVTPDIGVHEAELGGIYSHSIGKHIHIHGTTSEEMVLGVNDESQIANKQLCKSSYFKELLIKPESNRRYGQNKIETAKAIIDESMIICIFGMSIGKTDKMWWEYICKWLSGNRDRRLIIFVKKKDTFRKTKKNVFSGENTILEKMMDNVTEIGETWNVIRNQIYIEFNTEIFKFGNMV